MTTRIGLISDTHIPEVGPELPPEIYALFKGVDLILHAGDMHSTQVIEWLEKIAPVYVARGNGDDGFHQPSQGRHPKVQEYHVLKVENFKIGLTHDIPLPHTHPWLDFRKTMLTFFKEEVDIVVCGDTHVEMVAWFDRTLVVNPGSPTLPHQMPNIPGTVGLLDISKGLRIPQLLRLTTSKPQAVR
jgi:putative phosphoesterase